MRNSFSFCIFGNNYRTMQFAAAHGVNFLCEKESGSVGDPREILSATEVKTTQGWVSLSEHGAIDRYVSDSIGMINPTRVLEELCAKVFIVNFKFLDGWKPINIPKRLVSQIDGAMEASRMDPVISLVAMAGKATLRELEEYYSTEDAFKMYDMIAIDNLNKALGSEAAIAEAKSKRGK